MIFIDKNNKNQILTYVPLIQDNYNEWHIVSINLDTDNEDESKELLSKFLESYKDTIGFCYLESQNKAVSIMKLGEVTSYSEVKNNVETSLDNKKCRVLAKKMSANGLKQVQIDLSSKGDSKGKIDLFKAREGRDKNVIMVVDDDMFVRKSVCSLLSGISETIEVPDGTKALSEYIRTNPDIVILDIHMPNKSGLDVINEISNEDSNAFIVVSSSDSIRENVLEAVQRGAVGFLAKPIKKEKIFNYIDQCISFTQKN